MTNPHTAPAADLIHSLRRQAVTGTYVLADDAKFFTDSHWIVDKGIIARVLLERAIIRRAAAALIAAGYTLRVNDGEDWSSELTNSVDVVMGAIMATDEERIRVVRKDADGTYLGWLALVYGNDGWDVIADSSVSLEEPLQDTNDFADACGEVL